MDFPFIQRGTDVGRISHCSRSSQKTFRLTENDTTLLQAGSAEF